MKKNLFLIFILSGMISCSKTHCTDQDKSTWQDQDQFQENLKTQGYTIDKFKITSGNCYEIYGRDADQNKVEIYFNPVDGSKVKVENH